MRADRLLSILLLLQVHRCITARELARRLEVSERTIHRDMEALGAAGVPVLAERGARGGWRLLEAYETKLTGLNPHEVQAIFLASSARLLGDLGLAQASDAALIKLLAALPIVQRRDAEYARQRIHVDGAGWYRQAEAVPWLPTLQEAIWQERKVQLAYRRGDGTIVERLVDPLGLVAKGSVWYVVAAINGALRNYRASRVQSVVIVDQPYMRPVDFDLAAYWERSVIEFKANLPRYLVTLRAAPDVVSRIKNTSEMSRIEHIDAPDVEGWHGMVIRFDAEHEACEYVLRFGAQIEVLEPPALRTRMIDVARAMTIRYIGSNSGSQTPNPS